MLDLEKFIEVIGSLSRLRLLYALSIRPRSLAELSDLLKVSPQAVMKHLRVLEDLGLIASWRAPKKLRLTVKQLYRLSKPVDIHLIAEDRSFQLSATFVELEAEPERIARTLKIKSLVELYQTICEEEFVLKRKLKLLREKERRLIRELLGLHKMRDQIIKEFRCTPLEETILCAYSADDVEQEIKDIQRNFKLTKDDITKIWEELKSRKAL